MSETSEKLLRFVANLIIVAVWLWLFTELGWISFAAETKQRFWELFVLTALFAAVVEFIADWLFTVFVVITCGLGCVILPFYLFGQGWLWLTLTSSVTGWLVINVPFWWQGLVMSMVVSYLRIHPPAEKTEDVVDMDEAYEADSELPTIFLEKVKRSEKTKRH